MKWWERMKLKIRMWSDFYNPYHYWLKVRKWVQIPSMSFYLQHEYWYFYGLPLDDTKAHVRLQGLGWKSKYDMARWEWNPYFSIYIPNLFHFLIVWGYENKSKVKDAYMINLVCWEAILQAYLDDSINEETIVNTLKNTGWTTHDKTGKHHFTASDVLKSKYKC